jgi:protocatechuate 3,4-dioxygenase beta subunit
MSPLSITRKSFVRLMFGVLALAAARPAGNAFGHTFASVPTVKAIALRLTPGDANAEPTTPSQTEGPYFKPDSPERTSLVDDALPGTRLVITGRVLAADATPQPGALLDFWQADDFGVYDNQGFTLRGHQYTDADAYFTLETIVPGLYGGRTRHIHVKVQAPNGPVLTTQLYFPNEARNFSDGIFDPALVLPVQQTDTGEAATFDFVINTA